MHIPSNGAATLDPEPPNPASDEFRKLLEPVLKAHGYPSDAMARMTAGLVTASEIVPDILRLCSEADRARALDADVLACLLAAALLADQRIATERLHVALSLTETLARMMRFAEQQAAADDGPRTNRRR